MDLEKWTFLLSAYRLIEGASGAILRQGTIERVHLRRVLQLWHYFLFLSDEMAFIISFPGVL